MYRIAFIAAASLASLPAAAQSLDGSIWSGVPSGLNGTFQTGFSGSLNSGFGTPTTARGARNEDFTLGAGGGFNSGFLRGQPSNYGPSVQAMTLIRDTTLTYRDGPDTHVELGLGPADPLDGPSSGGAPIGPAGGGSPGGPIMAPASAMPSASAGGGTLD